MTCKHCDIPSQRAPGFPVQQPLGLGRGMGGPRMAPPPGSIYDDDDSDDDIDSRAGPLRYGSISSMLYGGIKVYFNVHSSEIYNCYAATQENIAF